MNRSIAALFAGRRALVLAGACTAGALFFGAAGAVQAQAPVATSAAATVDTGGWPIRLQGKPADFHPGGEGGYYLWHDDNGLHMWVTDPEGIDSHFTGTITTSGSIINVNLEQPENDDSYQQTGAGTITYDLHTQSGIDGLNFEIVGDAGTTLDFDLYRDGHKVATDHIFEGVSEDNAGHNPVDFVRH